MGFHVQKLDYICKKFNFIRMKKLKALAFALICAAFSPVKADEGMWLLQLMQEQNLADRMKAQGLKIPTASFSVIRSGL